MTTGCVMIASFSRIWAYIEENPVRAGYVTTAEAYRWSSAWGGL